MARPKNPPGTQRTYDIHFRIHPGIRAVMLEAMARKHCKTPSEYVRKLVEEDCQRLLEQQTPQEPRPATQDDLDF